MPYGLRATEAILATYVVVLFLLWFYLQQLWVSALLVISSVIISRILYINLKWRDVFQMPGPGPHPIAGNWTMLQKDTALFDQLEWVKQWGKTWRFVSVPGLAPIVFTCDPAVYRTIMATNDTPKGMFYGFFDKWLGQGLLTANGPLWKTRRRLLTPAFHYQILRKYIDVFRAQSDILVAKWKHRATVAQDSFDVFPDCTALTLDIIGQCAFQVQFNAQTSEPSEYVQAVYDATDLFYLRLFNPLVHNNLLYSMTQNGKKFSEVMKTIHELPDAVIKERRKVPLPKDEKYLDFLDVLLAAYDESTGDRLTDAEIRDEVDTFMFEGHDTTASALVWTLYCLAKYPDIQQRVQVEVDDVLADKEYPSFEDLQSGLRYLEMCLKESLRLYPPVAVAFRTSSKPLNISGTTVPAGTEILLSFFATQRNEELWGADVLEFKPERFKDSPTPFSYLPFSAGNRNCIGQNFALLEEKTMIALILKNFTLELDATHPVDPQAHVILRYILPLDDYCNCNIMTHKDMHRPLKGIKLYVRPRA